MPSSHLILCRPLLLLPPHYLPGFHVNKGVSIELWFSKCCLRPASPALPGNLLEMQRLPRPRPAAAAKSLQSCLTLCDPTQSETLEVDAITRFMQPCRDCPGSAADKNLPVDAGDMGLIPGLGRFLIPGASKPVCHSYWSLHALGFTGYN